MPLELLRPIADRAIYIAENGAIVTGLGRDYLARLVYGARISLLIGAAVALTSGLIGITLGLQGASNMGIA